MNEPVLGVKLSSQNTLDTLKSRAVLANKIVLQYRYRYCDVYCDILGTIYNFWANVVPHLLVSPLLCNSVKVSLVRRHYSSISHFVGR